MLPLNISTVVTLDRALYNAPATAAEGVAAADEASSFNNEKNGFVMIKDPDEHAFCCSTNGAMWEMPWNPSSGKTTTTATPEFDIQDEHYSPITSSKR